jgi:hypothetical protein
VSFWDQLHRWFGGPPPLGGGVQPRVDETFGDADVQRLLNDVGRGDYLAADRLLQATTDHDVRAFYVRCLARQPNRPPWLDLWIQKEGKTSATPWLVSGRHGIESAWQARSRRRAQDVSAEAFATFFARLERADSDLLRAAEMAPTDPLPHAERIVVAVGRELGPSACAQRFEEATRLAPLHFEAHRARLMSLLPKWGGATETSLAFATDASARAPDGSRVHSLVAWAHVERWLYFAFEERPNPQEQGAYLRSWRVCSELRAAHARGPGHAGHPGGWAGVEDANIFAFAFWLARDSEFAKQELERTRGILSTTPWGWWDEPVTSFREAKAWCLGA